MLRTWLKKKYCEIQGRRRSKKKIRRSFCLSEFYFISSVKPLTNETKVARGTQPRHMCTGCWRASRGSSLFARWSPSSSGSDASQQALLLFFLSYPPCLLEHCRYTFGNINSNGTRRTLLILFFFFLGLGFVEHENGILVNNKKETLYLFLLSTSLRSWICFAYQPLPIFSLRFLTAKNFGRPKSSAPRGLDLDSEKLVRQNPFGSSVNRFGLVYCKHTQTENGLKGFVLP